MLIDLHVENFRSVRDEQSITFEAVRDARLSEGKVTEVGPQLRLIKSSAIIGPNGAGKSTMVRALEAVKAFVCAPEEEENPLKSLIGNSFAYGETKGKPSKISVKCLVDGEINEYTIVADMNRIYRETLYRTIEDSKKIMFDREFNSLSGEYVCRWGRFYRGDKRKAVKRTPQNRTVLQAAALRDGETAKSLYNWFQNVLDIKPIGFASGSEKFLYDCLVAHPDWSKQIVNFLWSCDVTDVRDVVVQNGHVVFVHTNVSQKYGAYFASESLSLRRLSTIAASFFEAFVGEKVLVFDDFGMMLHPDIVSHVVEVFEDGNPGKSQMLAVDCNPSLLKDGLLRRDGIWFAEKQSDGSTKYYSLSDFKYSAVKLRTGTQYVNGAFGALPLTSDFRFNGEAK